MDDEALRREVQQALDGRIDLDANDVVAEAHGGDITLLGTVPDGAGREVAQEVAASVPGVRAVYDRLQVVASLDGDAEEDLDTEDLVPGRFEVH